ncbi:MULTISPECIES: efflux RND transporter periplasmic adaptor subunit [Pseudoalteromonas]|jgi:multidrug efflux system membrane fusion protein|uniref:MexE family multidrug efflux RND transporter periplasmic adaptor subunit n=1 Tax=Pseudoalteromonas atlantica TaxID=288 RepID=A0ABQ0UFN1_PSEAF|nr:MULTISPECIES: efflux RND transporter periplasmic adaptor subunit [unclassified Pseudoalteromonas]GEK77272.1 MexE family multidrug efflux RND transporter periplasmic adaptor subunit [Pseudoalteromonas atlantica]MDC9500402.1 efflux RND transporter periplasmic adaptor subunit [Pseudoalteromonas sp. Angola-18]MDC9512183.1 efflux RND transporter periplasmic adaptor subunit [Pseudoalteromonas sp. CST1]MDC9531153.1 efflux RND transporter periplasmic adaptor subunit [Pseudoalteromonas sp. Angola-7]
MNKHLIAAALAAATLSLAGCADESAPNAQQQQLQPIDVAQVLIKPVQSWHTYTTRLESPQEVALMPRVSGVIDSIEFKEGDVVKQGDVLFQLDERPFAAVVASLEAQIHSAEAALEQAKSEDKRAVRLLERKAISTEQAQARTSTLRQREAQLAALQAQLTSAKLDLEFTSVVSPIDGVISRANITKGNNVLAGQSVLTSIVSNKAMYAYFDVDERTWNSAFNDVTAQSRQTVVMQKVGQKEFAYQGYINFIDNQINSATGTLRVRAVFEQDNNQLRAGSFARVKLAANEVSEKVIIPERAIGTDLKNRFVLTVGENNVLEYKLIEVGERYGALRAVTAGLNEGDIIAVNGPARVGPGMPISPNTVTIDTDGVAFTLSNDNAQLMAKQ